jgi:GMP synthase (glutamine-hydrolysing)
MSAALPRILLLQARLDDDPVRVEEVLSFSRQAGLPGGCFEPWDLLEGPPTLGYARSFDALMVGGSGDFYVSKGDLPEMPRLFDFLAEWCDTGVPTFASCFGFQCLAVALGGEVIHDPERTEVGTFDLELTDAGRADEIFGELPSRFRAQLGRKDRAVRLPAEVEHLASSERCPYQALRLPGRPVWASQFHPELDADANRGRFLRYVEGYAPFLEASDLERVMQRFDESPEASSLLRLFVERILEVRAVEVSG